MPRVLHFFGRRNRRNGGALLCFGGFVSKSVVAEGEGTEHSSGSF